MKAVTRITATLALMLTLVGLQVQPLRAVEAAPAPAPGQGGAVTTCTPPILTSSVIVWNPDGSGTRTNYWQQSCTTRFTSADGTTTTTTTTHYWTTTDYIPAPNPVPVKPDTNVALNPALDAGR